jgi:predicted ribosome quality control (RQC) complex YloA/Tae2 family protein
MDATFYAYHALAREWQDLVGYRLVDAFTQQRAELTLAFEHPAREHVWRVQVGVRPVYLFRSEGYNRARRNTATLFEAAQGLTVSGVRIAERDRFVLFDFARDDGAAAGTLHLVLFGSRANVLWSTDGDTTAEAFQHAAEVEGEPLPRPRPARLPTSGAELAERWKGNSERALRRAWPLFDDLLTREALTRWGGNPDSLDPSQPDAAAWSNVHGACESVHTDALRADAPAVLWRGEQAHTLTLLPLQQPTPGLRLETVPSADQAMRLFARRALGQQRFAARYDRVHARLARAAERGERRVEQMLEALSQPSRADEHELAGHLLMAQLGAVPPHADRVTLDDLFEGGTRTLALDPALSPAENAQRYYERARAARRSRETAEERFERSHDESERLRAALTGLEAVQTLGELDAWEGEHAEVIATSSPSQQDETLPYRTFDIGGGYEAWVGKGAHQNDRLTLHHARPFDVWLHARGTPGSHVIVRVKGRQDVPPPPVLERAAALAAWYSKQRGSSLVPVIHSPRKHVRKPKGAPPGSVRVLREETLLVAPGVWKAGQ